MTKTKTPADPRTLRAAAVARILARKPANDKVKIWPGAGFPPASSLEEWIDDRVARAAAGDELGDRLIEIWELLRGGVPAVPAAADVVAALDKRAQLTLWMTLSSAPTAGDYGVVSALHREWESRDLRQEPFPEPPAEWPDKSHWNLPSEQARNVVYRTKYGQPA
jgi:hypothetical protein